MSQLNTSNDDLYYDREKLYAEAWTEPMLKVAARYGVSSVALAKTCRKLKVPVPPRGYWARVEAGQKPKQIPLPSFPNPPKVYRPRLPKEDSPAPEVPQYHLPEVFAEAQRLVDLEKTPERQIQVLEVSGKLHPVVEATKKALLPKSGHEYLDYGRKRTRDPATFDVSIGRPSIPRVVNILQALCIAFEERGFELNTKSKYGLKVMIMGDEVSFRILETSRKVEITDKKAKNTYRDYEWVPTGELRLEITSSAYRMTGQKIWSDSKTRKLETVLNSVISSLIWCAAWSLERTEYWRLSRIQEEIEQKKREEQERLRALDRKRASIFAEDAQKWNQYNQLTAYWAAINARYKDDVEAQSNDEYQKWLVWCGDYLKRANPIEKGPPQFTVSLL